jgi:hypothetical protein
LSDPAAIMAEPVLPLLAVVARHAYGPGTRATADVSRLLVRMEAQDQQFTVALVSPDLVCGLGCELKGRISGREANDDSRRCTQIGDIVVFTHNAVRLPRGGDGVCREIRRTGVRKSPTRKKLVKRAADPDDRRVVMVELTAAGLRYYRRISGSCLNCRKEASVLGVRHPPGTPLPALPGLNSEKPGFCIRYLAVVIRYPVQVPILKV